MKNKIITVLAIILVIVNIVITIKFGLKLSLEYSEGTTIAFTLKDSLNIDEVRKIAVENFEQKSQIKNLENFGDSAIIKVQTKPNEEQLKKFVEKINEKYKSELKLENLKIDEIPKTQILDIVEDYIFPILISFIIIGIYYILRFKNIKNILGLLRNIILCEGILYSIHGLGRLPVGILSISSMIIIYVIVIILSTVILENKQR